MSRRKIGLLSALVVLLVSISAFSAMSSAAQPPVPKVSEAETLYIAMQDDMPNLNIFDPQTNTVWKSNVIGWMYEGLLAYTPDFMIYNNLAESYEIQSTPDEGDVATVVVHLRHGVTFHDGEKMTAKDVVFSYQVLYWDYLYHSNLQCLYWPDAKWDRWDGNGKSHIGVEAVDDYTVKFHLSEQYPLFFYVTLGAAIIPEHIWKDHLTDAGTGDSQDMQLDYGYGKDTSEADATIGTGPWKFVDWVPKTYAVIEPYEGYWGKDVTVSWAGKEWPFYPKYVKKIVFKIYSTLDVAILALRQGEIDYIAWSITPGYYESLKDDPRIGFEMNTDQGFFYLAFNMRKAPMNDKPFRKAVAHCIDKDYIVDRLLHGYGIEGTVPIAITNPRYINESAIPPEFNRQKAKQVLDDAGYVDANGDGWRDMPDGSPIKLSILTPPKDYDPIRADAGIMISKNLKSVGLNIESSPTDFDTIVTKAFVTVQFDMYILGWAVGSFPETYLYDFFHSSQAAPAGYNAPGYSNPKVDQLLEQMMHEMDDEKRVKIIKDIEGILVDDLPYDVLYYRKNIEAYRQDRWVGWVSAYGSIYNGFSINTIHPPGKEKIQIRQSAKIGNHLLLMDIYMPETWSPADKVPIQVFVHDENYRPYAGAKVEVELPAYKLSINGTTDTYGYYIGYLDTPNVDVSLDVVITVEYSNAQIIDKRTLTIETQKQFYVTITPEKAVVAPGEQTTVTVKVIDLLGLPVSNASVEVDENTMLGSVDNTTKYTDENGEVQFTYTAPEAGMITNMHRADLFKVYVNYSGITVDNVVAVIGVNNNQGSSWYIVNIVDISDTVLSAGESATVTVKVTDISGNPVSGKEVYLEVGYADFADLSNWVIKYYVDTTNVSVDADHKTTDSNGKAQFTITANQNINNVRLIKAYVREAFAAMDVEGVYIGNESGSDTVGGYFSYIGMYSLQVSVDKTTIEAGEIAKATFKVLDENGNPVPNAVIWMKIPQSDYGQRAYLQGGLADDYFWAVGAYSVVVTGSDGTAQINITPVASVADVPITLVAWVDDLVDPDGNTLGYDAGFWSEYPVGTGAIQQIVLKRAKIMTGVISASPEIVTGDNPTFNLTVNIYGISQGEKVEVYYEWSLGSEEGSGTKNTTTGSAKIEISVPAVQVNTYIQGQILLYSEDSALNVPLEFKIPYITSSSLMKKLFILPVGISTARYNESAEIKVKVVDLFGTPVKDATVNVSGELFKSNSVKSDEEGIATFILNTSYVAVYRLSTLRFTAEKEGMTPSDSVYYGLLICGQFTSDEAVADYIANLTKKISDLEDQNEKLQNDLNAAQNMSTMYLIVIIVLIIIIIVEGLLLAKRKAAPAPKEEKPSEEEAPKEISEETEETTEEAPPAEESTEEKPPEEGGL